MKTTDERMNAVLGRARARDAALRRRRQRVVAFGGGALSIIAVVAIGIGIASIRPSGASSPSNSFGLMGSVLADSGAFGYVVVGLLGLVLGAAIAVVAYRLGRRRDAAESEKRNP